MELYNDDALYIHKLCGISLKENFRGFRLAAGFPKHMTKRLMQSILRAGHNAALIEETRRGKYVKDRNVAEIYEIGNA